MATTPEPRSRVHTPSTPLHGPMYDSYEPYSPRRTTRSSAQKLATSSILGETTPAKTRRARAITPQLELPPASPSTSRKTRRTLGRTTSQTFSPPSSPITPALASPGRNVTQATHNHISSANGLDSDSDNFASSSRTKQHLDPFTSTTRLNGGMLPTPAKTPRKRDQHDFGGAARMLFSGRPATIDEVMPSPKKARKAKHAAFSLGSFADEIESGSKGSKIEIYTDSNDRVPEVDEADENPFYTKPEKRVPKQNGAAKKQKLSVSEKDKKMDEKVNNEEGMVYVFRGKRIFRKYDNPTHQSAESDADSEALSDLDLRRRAGRAAHRPFLRSSVKPRLLFPTEEQKREREERDREDEEADTEIDEAVQQRAAAEKDQIVTTPVKLRRLATPPSTGRATRSASKKAAADLFASTPDEVPSFDGAPEPTTHQAKKPKKSSPFDSWKRVKSVSRAPAAGKKRGGDDLVREGEETGKRTRSGAFHGVSDVV